MVLIKVSVKCVSYLRKFMDEQYKARHIPAKLDSSMTVDQNLEILVTDQETRYPVILCGLKLFIMYREKEEPIIKFVHRVRRDIKFAQVEGMSVDQIAMLLIVGRFGIQDLQRRWGMDKELSLSKILREAETYTQMKTIADNRISSPVTGASVNKAIAGRGEQGGRG